MANGYEPGDLNHRMHGVPPDVLGRAMRDPEFRRRLWNDPESVKAERAEQRLEPISDEAWDFINGLDQEKVNQAMAAFEGLDIGAQ